MEYVTSSFGINIGTGLMLESILDSTTDRIDVDRDVPNKVKLSNYDKYLINVHSLIVNIISAYDKDSVDKLVKNNSFVYNDVKSKIVEELTIIPELLKDIKVEYYYLTFSKYKDFLNEVSKTTKGGLIQHIAIKLMNELVQSKDISVMISDHYFKEMTSKNTVLVSTSNTLDLLNVSKVNLDLLEFHTGVLKRKNRFYTKIKANIDLPFDELVLLSIGDKKGIIKSTLQLKERKEWITDLIARNLKPFNSYSREHIIGATKNEEIVAKLKKIPRVY